MSCGKCCREKTAIAQAARRVLTAAGLALAVALVPGCSNEQAPLNGRLKFADGSDVGVLLGHVVALDAGGGRIGASGQVAADGSFRIENAAVGTHRIAILPPPPPPDAPPPRPVLPAKYANFETSGLSAENRAGGAPLEIAVERASD